MNGLAGGGGHGGGGHGGGGGGGHHGGGGGGHFHGGGGFRGGRGWGGGGWWGGPPAVYYDAPVYVDDPCSHPWDFPAGTCEEYRRRVYYGMLGIGDATDQSIMSAASNTPVTPAVSVPQDESVDTGNTVQDFAANHPVWTALGAVSMAAGAYHGYKRNESVGWAIWWALMGGMFPVITPAIAYAQGFGKRKQG